MRITWLLERTDQLWGGVKQALEVANWLHQQGEQVVVLSRSGPPAWMTLTCPFQTVPDFRSEHLPDADVVVGTFWTTVPWAAAAGPGKGVPVHFCQGYEGDNPENRALRDRIEAVYRLPGVQHVTIAPNLTRLLREHFGLWPREIPYAIDHTVHRPGPLRAPQRPLRVGLVGPYQIAWKDLATGFAACQLAHDAGQPLVLVRATNTAPDPAERDTAFAVEWHQQLPPAAMGDFYRSLDVLLATSRGAEEGFFLPAVEAMACGVPVVMTDIPCFRAHGDAAGDHRYALFVPPQDPAAMAEALVVAGNVPEVRTALREQGLAVAGRYTMERMGSALRAALHEFAGLAASQAAPSTMAACAPTQRNALESAPAARSPAAPTIARPSVLTSAPTSAPHPAPSERTNLRLVTPAPAKPQPAPFAELTGQLRQLATRLLHQQQPGPAAQALAAAACLCPDDLDLQRQAAEASHLAGDHANALLRLDTLAQRGVDDEGLHACRGHVLHALGRMADAAQAFRAALAVGIRTADAYNRLGVVLFLAGDLKGARQNFEKALVLQPGHGDATANLAALPAA
jgi:hypothetical protein